MKLTKLPFFLFLEKYLAVLFVYILGISYKYRTQNEVLEERVIYAFWHRNQLPLLFLRKNEGITILISTSKDGDLIANPAKLLGYKTARGSSSKFAKSALKKLIRLSKKHSIAITPDGPKGPNMKLKKGALSLAYLTRIPLVPVKVDISSEWTINSWDKFRIPKPFATINIKYGDKIFIKTKQDAEKLIKYVENKL